MVDPAEQRIKYEERRAGVYDDDGFEYDASLFEDYLYDTFKEEGHW